MRAVHVLREKAQLRKQFGSRISPQLFRYLIDNPDRVSLEGEEKEVTCFFSDLAGFTSLSESLDSRQTVALLNRYMRAMNDELMRREAYVNKFLGDGIMAVWGAFASDPKQVELACRAALACVNRLEQLTKELEAQGLPRLAMRVGIATGVGTVGDCGAPPDLRDYTVIGDTANLAARLESANKQFGTKILIDGRTKELLPADLLTRPLGHVAVVGQQQATDLHELVAVKGEETPPQRDLIQRTTHAIERFRAGDFEGAKGAWRGIVAAHGPSPAADLYLEEIEARVGEPAPVEPVLRLAKK
jgi:adenylate cyclase